MNLTKLEQETIIIFNEAEEMASVETCNKALMKQLDELTRKRPQITEEKTDNYSKRYNLPKKWIKVRAPRELTDEQRAKLKSNAIATLHNSK